MKNMMEWVVVGGWVKKKPETFPSEETENSQKRGVVYHVYHIFLFLLFFFFWLFLRRLYSCNEFNLLR